MKEPINIKIIDTITNNYYQFSFSSVTYELNHFKSFVKKTLDNFNTSVDIFDILLIPGSHDCSILHYLAIEDQHELFSAILEEYKKQFQLISPSKWEFMLMESQNKCHEVFINFYGKEYFNQIAQSDISFVTGYSEPSFKKYYLEGCLDHFYKIDNMIKFDQNPTFEMIHAFNFFDANKNKFKNFMLERTQDGKAKVSSKNYKYENLIYTVQTQHSQKLKDGTSINIKEVVLTLPSQEDIDILIEKWGIKKTSKVLTEYLKFQKEYTINTNKNNLLKVSFANDKLNDLIKRKIDFSDCGEVLSFGLKNNTSQLAYFIINGIISKEDLLIHITDKELKKEANYHILNDSLDINNEPKAKKIKL